MVKAQSKASKGVTWLAACAALTAGFEGCDFAAKVDKVGTHHPVTWCHGETIAPPGEKVFVGEKFTKAECDAMLAKRLPQYWAAIEPCIEVETSDHEKIAYTSTAYNIGPGAFCGSAMLRDLNAGNHEGACNALNLYVHANGVVLRGLVRRRAAERAVCLTPDSVSIDLLTAIPKANEAPAEPPVAPALPKPPAKPVYAHWWSKFLSWSWWCET